MNQVKLQELIKEKNVVIPLFVLRMFRDFNLKSDELILLLYLYDKDKLTFNPQEIAIDLHDDMLKIMESISNLTDKGLVNVVAQKNRDVMEEVLDLEPLYNLITTKALDELAKDEENDENIHQMIEIEFNRRLSPLEHEMVDEWEKNKFRKDLIKEAVREASINGVSNLRYIDKILFDWKNAGIIEPKDLDKRKMSKKDEVEEIYNCDWLNEDDEEI